MSATGKGFTLWLTGVPAAGKTTLSLAIRDALRGRGHRVEVLDGDEIRQALSPNLGFSREDRDAHIRRIAFVARMLSRNDVIVVVAAVSPYRNTRDEARTGHEAPFVEVFVDCPMDELVRRDPKGLYAKAESGELRNLTGVSDPYEPPVAPEIAVQTERSSVAECRDAIVTYLEARGLV
jgi:adenylyl-sulfate kinase